MIGPIRKTNRLLVRAQQHGVASELEEKSGVSMSRLMIPGLEVENSVLAQALHGHWWRSIGVTWYGNVEETKDG